MTDINEILAEREKTHGSFDTHSILSQAFKEIMQNSLQWKNLPPYQKEALDMVSHKIARILNGEAYFLDHWQDLVGYLQLVVNHLESLDD